MIGCVNEENCAFSNSSDGTGKEMNDAVCKGFESWFTPDSGVRCAMDAVAL